MCSIILNHVGDVCSSFDAKRVIIRQGHMADNFYFILSGTGKASLFYEAILQNHSKKIHNTCSKLNK